MNRNLAGRAGGRTAAALIAALTLALTGLASTSSAADAPTVAVDITKFTFAPKEVTVAPGAKVRWINRDQTPHTVTSQDKSKMLASQALDTDDQYEFTFATEGDYGYYCTVHPFMTGVVHVRKP